MQNLHTPYHCRYCKENLDEGDALEYFEKQYSDKERAYAEAEDYGWSQDNKIHHMNFHNKDMGWKLVEENTNEVCNYCKGIFPFNPEKKRMFLYYRKHEKGSLPKGCVKGCSKNCPKKGCVTISFGFEIGRDLPLICRYCNSDLDDGDALEYFTKKIPVSEEAANEAKKYGWFENNKVRHINYYKKELYWGFRQDICGVCKGINPFDREKEKTFYVEKKNGEVSISPFPEGGKIVDSGATFSEDKKYRYELHRTWDANLEKLMFILLNPSTADAEKDDHTTKRCIEFAKQFKYGGMVMVNLFAFRSTDPRALKLLPRDVAIGPENKQRIQQLLPTVSKVVYCYGEKVKFVDPVVEPQWLKELIPNPFCFKKTKDGYPYHPRSIESSSELIPFREVTQETRNTVEVLRIETPETNANPIEMPQTYPDLPASPIMMEVNSGLPCMIVIDDEIILRYPLPEGKSQKDLMKHIMTFFLDE